MEAVFAHGFVGFETEALSQNNDHNVKKSIIRPKLK